MGSAGTPIKTALIYLLAVALALAVGLPFLGKAYTVDDATFVRVTENVLADPLRPLAGTWNWTGETLPLFLVDTNPPLPSYVLAPFAAAFGVSEVPLHAGMLLFLILLALSTASLSCRFAGGSAWPILFVMLSPAVAVSGNVMRDVPMAAFFTAAVALFAAGADRDRPWLLAAGAFLAGCAFLSKYSGASAFAVLAAYALIRRRPRALLFLPLGLVPSALWFGQNLHVYGVTHLGAILAAPRARLPWPDPALAALGALGASCFLLPPLIAALASRPRPSRVLAPAAAGLLAVLLARLWHGAAAGPQYLLWVFLGAGLLAALAAGRVTTARGRGGDDPGVPAANAAPPAAPAGDTARDEAFLALWLLLVAGVSIFLMPFQAVRHLIPALPPLCLLAARLARRSQGRPAKWVRALLVACLAVQAALAFGAARADARYAGVYRTYAHEEKARLAGPLKGRVWFAGHWGWQRYAMAAGWEPLAANGPQPGKGDLVIIPQFINEGLPPGLAGRLGLVGKRVFPAPPGLFTMNPGAGASFYLLTRGRAPLVFSFCPGVEEEFRVYEVIS